MIVPSIDLSGGRVVQLIGGEDLAIDAGDPMPLMERFARVGEVAVIDIDAARGTGSNAHLIEPLLGMGRVRVGGGIRDREAALQWLDAGAEQVIIGTAASVDLLRALPRDRVIVAADARDGLVVTHGWRSESGRPILDLIAELRDWCSGFLVTVVEREGRLQGTDLSLAAQVIVAAGRASVTIAGGVSTPQEIAELDRLGADAQVGMALYDGAISLGESVGAVLTSDRDDGLWPTVVVDEGGVAMGLAWSSQRSLEAAIDTGVGIYESRTRGLWKKGATSGASQGLIGVAVDCDRDALRFTVRQNDPGFCHTGSRSCWGPDHGIGRLERRISDIAANPPQGSNTALLLRNQDLLDAKLLEEVGELVAATNATDATHELADLIYFAVVKARSMGVDLTTVTRELDRRERRVSRRPMEGKGAV